MPRFVSPLGKLVYGSLVQAKTNDYGQTRWSAGLRLPEKESQEIALNIEKALADKRAKDPRFPATNDKLSIGMKVARDKQEDGTFVDCPGELVFTFQRKFEITSKAGEKMRNSPPRLYDATGSMVEGLQEVGWGSMGKVIYDVYPWATPTMAGVQLQLIGFQIAELAESRSQLTPIEGGWVAEGGSNTEDIASILQSA